MSEPLAQRLAHCSLGCYTVIVLLMMFVLGVEELGVGAWNWEPTDLSSSRSYTLW